MSSPLIAIAKKYFPEKWDSNRRDAYSSTSEEMTLRGNFNLELLAALASVEAILSLKEKLESIESSLASIDSGVNWSNE